MVKAIRIFLAVVVLVMSISNILFIVVNWNTEHHEAAERSWPFEKEERKRAAPNQAIETFPSPIEAGMSHFFVLINVCLN